MTVSVWASRNRIVPAETGTASPGIWSNDLTPYLVEPMDCLSANDPSTDVTLVFAAQTGKSEVGVNFTGYTIDIVPCGMLIAMPSIDEAHKFTKIKLQPTIDASPALKHKVRETKSRDENGSTASFKKFRGGFIQITHTGSSKGLQAITVRNAWGDEISEWDHDVGGRGDPVDQIIQRSSTFELRGAKRLWTSTPKLKGECRITAKYEVSDQRRLYWPCSHCGDYFTFRFDHLKWDSEHAPFGAHIVAPCCGGVIEHWQKRAMLARSVWIKSFPAADDTDLEPGVVVEPEHLDAARKRPSRGRQPGFHLWRGQSNLAGWDSIVGEYLAAKDSAARLKTFTQQVLAEAFEQAGEAPDHLKLLARRDEDREKGTLPDGVLALCGMADVQANRLEWAVYGFGERMTSWLVDFAVIPGDPEDDATWAQLAQVQTRLYEDQYGRSWPIEAFGVDTGYKSHAVYNFARKRPNVFATDGRDGATRPFIGTPKKVDVTWKGKTAKGGALLWPLGTYPLKSALYAALQKTIDGPDKTTGIWPAGCIRFPKSCDEAFFLQITAEYLDTIETRDGFVKRVWRKRAGQANEQLDLWVGARAMAAQLGLDRYTPAKWDARRALHAAPDQGGNDDLLSHAARQQQQPLQTPAAARTSTPQRRRTIMPNI
ncbi:MAG: phage terminase large subunit family protein [Alphaproteobacteria bacterium]|nr:phage terminase large subunit family protein [Alphaproteobacteria bacterium]